jgi:hypothetical protein
MNVDLEQPDGRTVDILLSLSISETIRGDTQTQVDTLKQVFNDLSGI